MRAEAQGRMAAGSRSGDLFPDVGLRPGGLSYAHGFTVASDVDDHANLLVEHATGVSRVHINGRTSFSR